MKKSVKIFYWTIIAILLSTDGLGQNTIAGDKEWKEILVEYESGKIVDTTYCRKAKDLAFNSFTDTSLKQRLELYRKIAWSKKAYHLNRLDYYVFLTNNATFTYKAGSSIYYAEKFDEEMKKEKPYMSSFLSTKLMLFIYGRNKSGYKRCTEEFARILPIIETLPQRIINDSVPRSTCSNVMALLADQADIYHENKDTNNLHKISDLSDSIYNGILKKAAQYKTGLSQYAYFASIIKYHEKSLAGAPEEIHDILRRTYATIASSTNPIWKKAAEGDMQLRFLNFFIAQKQHDSAKYYLQLLKTQQGTGLAEFSDGTVYLLNNGKLKAIEGDYKTAYENVLRAYEINDSVIGVKTADINNNMYAQSVAEYNAQELQKAETKRQQRNVVILIIAVVSLICILFLYLRMRRKDREAKNSIQKLNFASQLQIMELEEKNLFIKKEEKKKLGMELHDNLAGDLAAIKLKIESELINNTDAGQKDRLKKINELITAMYESTRNKSHELYHGWNDESEISFSKRIKLITDNAFNADKFTTEIIVDDHSLEKVSLTIKIELLYIIKESITNIIKHAMANKVTILIYEEINELILHITDNGRGFNTNLTRNAVGLNSIKDRVAAIGGKAAITPTDRGTETYIAIPT